MESHLTWEEDSTDVCSIGEDSYKSRETKRENFISSPTATKVNSIKYREQKIIVMLN